MMLNDQAMMPEIGDRKVEYLQMIQGVIDRMSTVSAIYKGFASAILAGVVTIAFCDVEWFVLAILFLPMAGLMMLDVRHLCTERAYRDLFNEVRDGRHPVDFDLDVHSSFCGCSVCKALRSWSVWLFYGPLFTAWLVLMALRFCCVG